MSISNKPDELIFSFAPIANLECKILILGTVPGKESLRQNAYYAHPQNGFWKIIFQLHHIPYSTDINARNSVLLQNRIALWDVLKVCRRKSSLDSHIRDEVLNDLQKFLHQHPNIQAIFFNGKSAATYFKKYFPDIGLPTYVLPSRSPANAIRMEQKVAAWEILKPF